ncbi:MAG: hypothetical protein IJ031_07820 [Oscillospiraceae bacterium]|nr:hypothetical protein [Oscillospiraceae bacterium]MBQ8378491.1 hypothetical protein [Oscillospiraceae bacterium]MBQ8884476.1 hypothetical protein [Oscillospiraceae bacterium]
MSERKKYAEVSDIKALGKPLTTAQLDAAEILLETASSKLRITATKYGKDIDKMIADETLGADYELAVKGVVIQAVVRALDSMSDYSPAITQGSQSAMGYSVSMTYLNAGQSLYFLRNELKDLGILRQTWGAMEVYGNGNDD